MKIPLKYSARTRFLLAAISGFLLVFAPSLQATQVWKGTSAGGDGQWNTAANWVATGVPDGSQELQFRLNTTYTAPTAEVTVGTGYAAKAGNIKIQFGKAVTFSLQAGASLTGGIVTVGNNLDGDAGSAKLTIQGPETGAAVVEFSKLSVNGGSASRGTVNLSGANLTVKLATDTMAINSGGSLIISNGASVTGTTGGKGANFYLYATGTNGLNNRMILEKGSVAATSIYTFAGSLLQLSKNATLTVSTTVYVNYNGSEVVGGRFEVEGADNLTANLVRVYGNGILAVGLSDPETYSRDQAAKFTLNSKVQIDKNGILELGIFGSGASGIDQIKLDSGAIITLATGAKLNLTLNGYTPIEGETWTLFTGNTAGITGNFDFSLVDTKVWDISKVNQAGGWVITSLIPEPSTTTMILLGGAGCLAFILRRKREA